MVCKLLASSDYVYQQREHIYKAKQHMEKIYKEIILEGYS